MGAFLFAFYFLDIVIKTYIFKRNSTFNLKFNLTDNPRGLTQGVGADKKTLSPILILFFQI
jgi:hypothetical protein